MVARARAAVARAMVGTEVAAAVVAGLLVSLADNAGAAAWVRVIAVEKVVQEVAAAARAARGARGARGARAAAPGKPRHYGCLGQG